jgi:DNA-binding SARP family transcriptional activator
VQFRILGPLEVVDAGRQVQLGRPKQRAVLAVLLLHANRVVALDRLVQELWGEQPPPQAIGSLQAYVSHLRRLLEPGRSARTPAGVLLSQPPGYRLAVAAEDLDAARFQTLAADGHALLEAGDHRRAAAVLGEGLALWRGPVLADFGDAPFAQPDRARLEELRLVALEDRITAELALGRHSMVVAELEQLVAAHPFRERLHGLRMLALYRSGRQAEALQAYQAAGRTLRDELGIDPGPWLRRLEADILIQSPDLDLPPAAEGPPPTAPAAPPPAGPHGDDALVGREAQLAAFEATLAGVAAGRGRVVLVAGEPGIGKTRLAEEVARRAAAGGAGVAWGRCAEEQGAPPFWPWVQVLRGLLAGWPPERLRDALGPFGPELAELLPELAELAAPAPAAPVLDVEAVRFRRCQAVIDVLRRLAAGRPLLLVVDDLHWADVASLRLLSLLAGELRGAPLLVVGTYRHVDADGGPLADTLAALARQAPVERMTLGGLSPGEVAQMMTAALGAEPDERLARVVHDRTAGNPFFVVELLRLLGSEGRLGAPADVEAAVSLEVPAGVRDVLRRRLARLPEQTNAVLLVAAVAGREFDLDTVQAVTGLDDAAALEAMEAALLSGLVVEDAERVGRFRFAHALVRDAIYDDASRARRARLHARIGQALLARDGTGGGNALALAHHWWLAAPVVDADAVLPHLLAAADQALGSLAHEQAERQLGRALELLASMRPSDERDRAELGVRMRLAGLSAQLHGIAAPATREAGARAAGLAEQLGDDAATIAAHRNLYEVAVARAEHAAARELAERMLEIAERAGDPTSLAITQFALGRTLWCQGEPAAARERLEHGLRLAGGAPEAQHEPLPVAVTVQLQLAPVLDLLGLRQQAVELVDAAIERTRDLSPLVRAGVLTSAALVTGLRHDPALAGEHAAQAFALAGKPPAWLSYATAVQSWAQALHGDPEGGARRLRESLDDIQARGAQHLVPWGLGLLAEAELLAGRPGEALGLLDDALARAERSGERMYLAELHRLRGQALLAFSPARPAEARAALDAAVAVARAQGAELLERRATGDLRRLGPAAGAHSSSDSHTPAPSAPLEAPEESS